MLLINDYTPSSLLCQLRKLVCSLFVRPGHYVVLLSHPPHAFTLQRLVLLPERCGLRIPAPPSNRMTTPSRAEKDTNTPRWDSRVHRWSPSRLSRTVDGLLYCQCPAPTPCCCGEKVGKHKPPSSIFLHRFITFMIYRQHSSTVSFELIANKSHGRRVSKN